MKKLLNIVLFSILVLTSFSVSFAEGTYEVTKDGCIVYHEDYSECEEFEIDTSLVDNYINSLKDPERIKLINDIIHLPVAITTEPTEPTYSWGEDALQFAKELAALPIEELRIRAKESEETAKKLLSKTDDIFEPQRKERMEELKKAQQESLKHSLTVLKNPLHRALIHIHCTLH